ncbi:MAG: hypothetical protein HGA85_02850 [Nanoarchaeota archaeon]|nr:hypothetical protein [Nanoarchaeota archaeon]
MDNVLLQLSRFEQSIEQTEKYAYWSIVNKLTSTYGNDDLIVKVAENLSHIGLQKNFHKAAVALDGLIDLSLTANFYTHPIKSKEPVKNANLVDLLETASHVLGEYRYDSTPKACDAVLKVIENASRDYYGAGLHYPSNIQRITGVLCVLDNEDVQGAFRKYESHQYGTEFRRMMISALKPLAFRAETVINLAKTYSSDRVLNDRNAQQEIKASIKNGDEYYVKKAIAKYSS